MKKRCLVCALSASLVLTFATRVCAEGFPAYHAPSFPFSTTRDGLVVAARPLADEDDLDRYFGDDLLDDGVLPVFVSLENHSPDRSFIVLKENVAVSLTSHAEEGDVASPTAGGWVSTAGVAAMLVVPVASLVLLPIGVNMVSNAYEAKRNFVIKELQSHTLSPGATMAGFVYLKAPEGSETPPQNFFLRVEALKPASDDTTRIELPVSWAR